MEEMKTSDADHEKALTTEEAARAEARRKFGVNTCPASRHVHLMADALAEGARYAMFDEDPDHCAQALYSVIGSLWEARSRLIEAGLGGWPPDDAAKHKSAIDAALSEPQP